MFGTKGRNVTRPPCTHNNIIVSSNEPEVTILIPNTTISSTVPCLATVRLLPLIDLAILDVP